jgi:hypothetical protein
MHRLLRSHRAGPVTWGQPIHVQRLSGPNGRITDSGLPFREHQP